MKKNLKKKLYLGFNHKEPLQFHTHTHSHIFFSYFYYGGKLIVNFPSNLSLSPLTYTLLTFQLILFCIKMWIISTSWNLFKIYLNERKMQSIRMNMMLKFKRKNYKIEAEIQWKIRTKLYFWCKNFMCDDDEKNKK